MRYLVNVACVLALVALPLSVGAQDGGQSPTSEPNRQEPASLPEPAPEVPDIATLSQRSIEQYETRRAERWTPEQERRRQRGLRIGVPIVLVTAVAVAVGAALMASSLDFSSPGQP
jgi:hypothetical protein